MNDLKSKMETEKSKLTADELKRKEAMARVPGIQDSSNVLKLTASLKLRQDETEKMSQSIKQSQDKLKHVKDHKKPST